MMKISKSDLESIIDMNDQNKDIPKELRNDFIKAKKYFSTLNPEEINKNVIKTLNNIDEIFFSKWKGSIKLPAYFAIILTFSGLAIQLITFMIIFVYFQDIFDPTFTFFIVFVLTFIESVVFHVPAHYLIGLLVGIKSKNVFIATSSIGKANIIFNFVSKIMIVPGLKYDLGSFLNTSKRNRAIFLSAGVWLTYPLMYINLIITLTYQQEILPDFITIFVMIFIFGLSIFVLITSLFYYGDLYKAKQIFVKREKLEII
ncbi:MAG: hypothetical protein ACW981_03555 [Candidatus Hodarchaeales archaeon]